MGRSRKTQPDNHSRFKYEAKTKTHQFVYNLLQTFDKDTIILGPAGTGKTYVACAVAVEMFQAKKIGKIVIARPAEGPCKSLGFEPGDMKDKLEGWVKPVVELLSNFLGRETIENMIDSGKIELLALHQVTGRTFDNAVVIVDEWQNCNRDTILSLITRMGQYSKLILSGDIRQSNIKRDSGAAFLLDLCDRRDMGFDIVELGLEDVVRSKKVKNRIEQLMYENIY